ncbi:MAG TPA: transferrin receptor-like dimerization domain-containing protein, partial [Terriglobales bacterium]|nr:transferrin receptor-like dimerization domain-containing protein [Terriglobales bacterium]
FPGDPTTPGIPSLTSLPEQKRVPPEQSAEMPRVPTTPLAYSDAAPILQNLGGPDSPREWQGALPFTYHVGPGPVRVKMHLKQNYGYHTIWDVIGTVAGSESPEQWVVSGNHRDAWVYGAVDPNSGTTAQLEAVRGIGSLLKSGWRPRRTLVFASWDAEEFGLIGSTEWGEEHQQELANAAVYFNMDVGVAGPNFGASAVPSLKQFIRDVSKSVPSPKGGTVYEAWQKEQKKQPPTRGVVPELNASQAREPKAKLTSDVPVGDLGSGSDYTVFLQHLGVPSSDIGSRGPYGVYHSAFDDFEWFKKFGDPTFVYEQQMARVYGVQAIRMASADVLPFDYEEYGKEINAYLVTAQKKAQARFGEKAPDFTAAQKAAGDLTAAGAGVAKVQMTASGEAAERLNRVLIRAERGFLTNGLPKRTWYKHAIYAPGEYTGYEAVVIPGVNEALDKGDLAGTVQQIAEVTAAIERVATILESYR